MPNPLRVVLQASQTTTTSSTGNIINVPAGYHGCILHLNVTAASGTSPTLNVYVQDQLVPAVSTDVALNPPSGTALYADFASFLQMTAAGDTTLRIWNGGTSAGVAVTDGTLTAGTVNVGPVGLKWRIKWVLTATTPSFTWSLVGHFIP